MRRLSWGKTPDWCCERDGVFPLSQRDTSLVRSMLRCLRHFLFFLLLLLVTGSSGCQCVEGITDPTGGSGGTGGAGGEDAGPCGMDCAELDTPSCTEAVCNTGQVVGPINTCIVVAAPQGTSCDDGLFCTDVDTCDGGGVCVGGPTNDCGMELSPCDAVICSEETKTCSAAPVNDGTECTPIDLCELHGVCQLGECVGEPKSCALSPLNECNEVECDSATGDCVGTPDPDKENSLCFLTGPLCQVEKTCQAGECGGGVPKDCSNLSIACELGECDPGTGICGAVLAPEGTACDEGITECKIGECDDNGICKAEAAPTGSDCNDHDSCTAADECVAGACAGTSPVLGCSLYFKEGFEICPNGWTFGGDWECGVPMAVGPPAAHSGNNVIATNTAGLYSVNQSYTTTVASSPPIDLTGATTPTLSFWTWYHTEGGSFDGWNLQVSTNGGTTFVPLSTVTPAYPLTVATQPAYGGNHSAEGWQNYRANLTAFAGQTIILRFAFRSDAATVFPGVYIDDIFVSEPLQDPLYITTSSISDTYVGVPQLQSMTKVGGTAAAEWSIVPGGVNTDWLSINPATGSLSGAPAVADVGPVSVTIRVEEPSLPTNYDEKTFDFVVGYAAYYTSFEGACPDGWTLLGTWQCGVPTLVGPTSAYVGNQCVATQISANYLNSQAYATATATSPDIDLSGSVMPTLTWRMWVNTEGSTKDGVNLKVSTDGGANYELVDTVSPAYPLVVAGEPAWGDHDQNLGWQPFQANLAAYAGEVIRLRFSFASDSSEQYPGIYVDDFLVQ